jgi:hypothetical protein
MASKFSKAAFKADELLLMRLYKKAGYKDSDLPTLIRAVRNGNLAMEAMFETAVARVGQMKRVDIPGMDHEDGSDCKKITAVRQGGAYGAWFSVKNKKGMIRAIVVEPKTEKIYYFKFPPKFYIKKTSHRKKKSIAINFSADGSLSNLEDPRATYQREVWSHQVKSFKELCS